MFNDQREYLRKKNLLNGGGGNESELQVYVCSGFKRIDAYIPAKWTIFFAIERAPHIFAREATIYFIIILHARGF